MSDNAMFAFKGAPTKARCVVQEDTLDDSTKCSACGMAEMLGYVCDMCEKMHCGKCLKYEVHRCEPWAAKRAQEAAATRQAAPTNVPSFRTCCHTGCGERTPVAITCRACNKNFCSRHKLESDHNCPAVPRSTPAPAKPATTSSTSSNPFAALFLPSSLLKREEPTTVVAPDVHVDDRYPISVMFPHVYHHAGPKRVVVHKKWGLGRTVDFLLKEFGNKTGEARHILVRAADLSKLPTISSFRELNAAHKLAKTDMLLLLPESWYTTAIAQFDTERLASSKKDLLWKQFYSALPDLVGCAA